MSQPTRLTGTAWRRLVAGSSGVLLVGLLTVVLPTSAFATTFNVLSYGAVGNGTTNDRAAIQAAIDAANGAGGGTVEFPAGYTFLTGDVTIDSRVTLLLDTGSEILQSQNPSDYAHTPSYGRFVTGSTIPFNGYADQDWPVIYSGGTSNVAITGGGTIEMTHGATDATSIIDHAIGFYQVSGFSISGITIDDSSAYNMTIRESNNGSIDNVTTTNPWSQNSDGVSLMDSQYIHVYDNNLTTQDDGIYVWASYNDPRGGTWWSSNSPEPSHDIEIDHNTVDNQATNGSHGFTFIDWTTGIADAQQVEISRINVHDNSFTGPVPFGALYTDPYHTASGRAGSSTPTKDLTFHNNTLTSNIGGPDIVGLNHISTTDFSGDSIYTSYINSSSVLLNADFDATATNTYIDEFGVCFWSVEGGGGVSNASVGQPGGYYGQIQNFQSGYAGVYQGVYLTAGPHTFTAHVQSSGASIRLFAIQASTITVMASLTFTNTSWASKSITFTVTTAGTYRLGIDHNTGNAGDWGRMDSTTVT